MTCSEPIPEVWAIVVAAGSGSRFGGAKQYLPLGDARVIDHSVTAAAAVSDGVVVVVPAADVERFQTTEPVSVVAGAATRSGSVRAGLAAVPSSATVVVVHDGARPLASAELFRRVVDAVGNSAEAAVPVVAVNDTIRDVDGHVVDRDRLRAVQTPQAFTATALRAAHANNGEASDDAALVQAAGGKVVLVEGHHANTKITTPIDLEIARLFIEEQPQ